MPTGKQPEVEPQPSAQRPGERARDEQRPAGGPRYGGRAWTIADERGERRFGHARNDDADPSELERGSVDDDGWPGDDANVASAPTGESPELAEAVQAEDTGRTERGAERAGHGRGELPRKPRTRGK
jgi:hypothetical protein